MTLMDMTWEEFTHLFRTVRDVYGIYEDGKLAGFCWVEIREAVLHLHGLMLKEPFWRHGIGTRVLHELEARYGDGVNTIEAGVHESNHRAKKSYQRLGYETVKTSNDLGFDVMQKHLPKDAEPSASGSGLRHRASIGLPLRLRPYEYYRGRLL
jgi:RimJ/RimL family protein N-acetyltransferase